MINKLIGREKVQVHIVANKLNEIIDLLMELEKSIKPKEENKEKT